MTSLKSASRITYLNHARALQLAARELKQSLKTVPKTQAGVQGIESAIEDVDKDAQEQENLDSGRQAVGDIGEETREDLAGLHHCPEDC